MSRYNDREEVVAELNKIINDGYLMEAFEYMAQRVSMRLELLEIVDRQYRATLRATKKLAKAGSVDGIKNLLEDEDVLLESETGE